MDYYVAPPGPDGGIDLIAHTDPLGTTGPRIKVQVKRRDDDHWATCEQPSISTPRMAEKWWYSPDAML
jgi:predicted Mrr-cat superfamily restriction endonuclease